MNSRWAALVLLSALGCSNPGRDLSSGTPSGGAGGDGSSGAAASAGSGHAGGAGFGAAGSSAAGSSAAGTNEAGSSDAEAGAAGALASDDSLQVLSVTPGTAAATTRSSISVSFSQPVTPDSVAGALVVTDDRGPVAGEFTVSGAVATFRPRGSLCLAQSYKVSIGTAVSTLDGQHLDRAKSYQFSIPDGEWGDPQTLRASAAYLSSPAASVDADGNALAVWTETADNTPTTDYYDARVSSWNGAQTPPFVSSNGVPGLPLAGLRGGHGLVVFPSYGAAERTANGVWSVTASSDLEGSIGNFSSPSLAVADSGTALLVWNDNYGSIGASSFTPASDAAHPGYWIEPTASAIGALGSAQLVHALPDGSFMLVFAERATSSSSVSNLAAQRYVPGTGWSSEHKIAAGGATLRTAQDNFGNLVAISDGGTPVARYSYDSDSWTVVADIAPVAGCLLALAGDGRAFCVYFDDNVTTGSRVLVQTLVDKTWSAPAELRNVSASISLSSLVADDCGNAQVVWLEGDPGVLYTRRFTPSGGWGPALTLGDVSIMGQAAISGRGEMLYVYGRNGTSDDTDDVETIRFE